MKHLFLTFTSLFLLTTLQAVETATNATDSWATGISSGLVKAFCVDFNWAPPWAPGRENGFAKPGLWADADPLKHVAWYEALGCNVIQTFAVSGNGYAWYKGGVVPEQPGLAHDFLPEMVKLGHAKKMLVLGYFCASSNTRWGEEHPTLSYGTRTSHHLPFTDEYLDYLSTAIEDALRKTGMDGFMIDWVWNPTEASRQKATGGKWIEAEKKLFTQLMGKPFPGETALTPEDKLAYERKAIDHCWARIHAAAKHTNPNCIIWLSCDNPRSPALINSTMLKEVDWIMDEQGNPKAMKDTAAMFGPQTKQMLCLVGWHDVNKTLEVLSDPASAGYSFYGYYGRPDLSSLPLPIATYLSRPIDSFRDNDRGVATLARYFTHKPFDYVFQGK